MKPLQIGIVSRSFPGMPHAEVARLLREAGAASTELCLTGEGANYWVYNGRSDISGLSDEDFAGFVEAYRREGIHVASVGVFTNLIHPEDEERRQNLDYFERHMELAAHCGIPYVSTECGFTPGQRGINTERYEADFNRLIESLRDLCSRAERYGVWVVLETCVIDVVPSAKRARDLWRQVGSDRLKFLLDPANLIANSSEEDMFDYLAPHIAYFHGKDRKVNDVMGRAVGDGDIDWPLFLRLYHQRCEGLPFILEYVNKENFRDIMARVEVFDEKARAES